MKADNDNVPAIATRNSPANANRTHTGLRFLSVCSGIEAASCAWPQWQTVAFSEIEKFPSALLAHHYPDVPNLGDFTKIDTTTLGQVDILCGGTPCQAFSVAGLRRSLNDARGNLSLAFVELAHELAGYGRTSGNGLRNVVWENVVGVLSTKDNAFGCFLAGLVGADGPIVPPGRWTNAGMVSGPKGRAAWRVLDAQYFGVAQRRRRVIVVADFGNGADPAAVLFEPEGVRRHSPPSREAGQGVAPTISARTKGGGGLGTDFDLDGGLVRHAVDVAPCMRAGGNATGGDRPYGTDVDTADSLVAYAPEIARCDATREGSSQDYETTTMVTQQVYSIMPQNSGKDYKARPVKVAQPVMAGGQTHGNQGGDVVCITGNVTHTLKAEGADASEDGTGRGTPIIAFTAKDYGGDAAYDIAPTLRAGTHSGSHANAGVMPAVTVALRGRDGGATAELGGEVATALRASSGGGDKPHVLECRPINTMIGLRHQALGERTGLGIGDDGAPSYTITKEHSHAVQVASAVRRLTPVECERLQGFPDNYTAIPWRGRPTAPDGPRYKALGNSWAVPLFAWLGRRIDAHMPAAATTKTTKDTARAA